MAIFSAHDQKVLTHPGRIPYVTFRLLSSCGVIVHQTYNQLVQIVRLLGLIALLIFPAIVLEILGVSCPLRWCKGPEALYP